MFWMKYITLYTRLTHVILVLLINIRDTRNEDVDINIYYPCENAATLEVDEICDFNDYEIHMKQQIDTQPMSELWRVNIFHTITKRYTYRI